MSNFYRPSEGAVPPTEIRFIRLAAEPYPDGRRVRVNFALTPFLQPPNIVLSILDSAGEEVAHASIIEAIEDETSFTLHLRRPSPGSQYVLTVTAGYPDLENVHTHTIVFVLPA